MRREQAARVLRCRSAARLLAALAHSDGKCRFNIIQAPGTPVPLLCGRQRETCALSGNGCQQPLPVSICNSDSWEAAFLSFLFSFFLIYKKRLVLESVLRKMINASAGLSQDVAQWLVLIKRLQVNSGFWLHCGENKWGVCDASYVTMKEPPDGELQGMSPHVLHLSWAHVHAVYHTHKYSEIIHVYTRLATWKITVWVQAAIFFFKALTGLCDSFGNTGSENLSTTHWVEVFFSFFFFSQMRGLSSRQGSYVGWREYPSWMETLLCVITFSSVTIKETAAQWPSVCFPSIAWY